MAERNRQDDTTFSLPAPEDLRGRQSVRATFKISARAIEALSIVSTHLGVKQKSLFDLLIEDVESLETIARGIEAEEYRARQRVQKTYVISRRTLLCLERISRRFDAPRDALVEYSIQRLLPVIERERKKHRWRKQVLAELEDHLAQGLKLLEKAKARLGDSDPVTQRLAAAVSACLGAQRAIEAYVERGSVIEDF